MRNAHLFKFIVVLLLLGLVVVACTGGTAEPTEEPEPAATEAPAEEEAEAEEEVAEEPTEEPMEEPTEEPMEEPTEEPMEEPTEEPMEEPTEEAMAEFTPMVMTAESCDYGGLIQEIAALDELTVQFTMCRPDPAFRSKAAFTAFAIQPSEYLEATGGTGDILEHPIGTGPYVLDRWSRGEEVVFTRNDAYWGEPAATQTLVFRWSTEGAARLLELQSGSVDGIDNPSPDDFETIANDSALQLIERPALNIFYLGMNNTYPPFDNEMVRQAIAMGIDRQRIVDNFYPAGSEVASHFTPCSIPNGCTGDSWYEFDPEAARALLTEAGFEDGFTTVINYRDVFRGYLPEPSLVAQDIQAQLLENLNITAEIEVMESGAFIAAADAGELQGLHLLGWGADYPDITNFLDFHFGAGASAQFGAQFDDITAALTAGAALADDAAREPHYVEANNAVRLHVPMVPIAHGGSATAFQAGVEGAHASPLGNEYFAVMNPGKDTFVWMQNAEPISLYCADETDGESLRACEQVTEALLAYEVGGTAVEPALATACDPNEDLTVWTCTLREGVLFHDGSKFDANDVVLSWGLQWDAAHPLHVGNTGAFTYFSALWGGLLNAPAEE
jgi:ABC-type transport system substrate-binding protein